MSILAVMELSKSFFQGEVKIEVLKRIDLQVEKGETIAIIGQSGSGKSTLLSLLAGLDTPTSGHIVISEMNLADMSECALAKFRAANLAIIFQQYHLMSQLTALENVMLPLEILNIPNAQTLAGDALNKVGLSHRSSHFPATLSGGERQRVAIARTFVVNPKVLLADEPSGNLDVETGEQTMNLLFDLVKREKMTMILVTHNQDLARRCDHAFQLRAGILEKIAAWGKN